MYRAFREIDLTPLKYVSLQFELVPSGVGPEAWGPGFRPRTPFLQDQANRSRSSSIQVENSYNKMDNHPS